MGRRRYPQKKGVVYRIYPESPKGGLSHPPAKWSATPRGGTTRRLRQGFAAAVALALRGTFGGGFVALADFPEKGPEDPDSPQPKPEKPGDSPETPNPRNLRGLLRALRRQFPELFPPREDPESPDPTEGATPEEELRQLLWRLPQICRDSGGSPQEKNLLRFLEWLLEGNGVNPFAPPPFL
jgi:hypothetical protein